MLEWATVVDAEHPGRDEPNAGKKAVGFDDGEAPPASWHNWLFGLAGDWISYLDAVATSFVDISAQIALKTLANTFEFGQQINPSAPDDPMVSTTVEPGSDTWLECLQLPCTSTFTARLYWGGSSSAGYAALVINAAWNAGLHVWDAEDDTKDSVALLLKKNAITDKLALAVSQRNAGAGTWALWPDTSGAMSAAEFRFASTQAWQGQVNVLHFLPLSGSWSVGIVSGVWEAGGSGDEGIIPLTLPHGVQVNRLHVLHSQTDSNPNEFHVLARRKTDWPSPGNITPPATALPAHGVSEVRTNIVGPSSSGVHYSVSDLTFNVDNYSETLVLQCIAGAAGNAPLAVLVERLDVTLNNR